MLRATPSGVALNSVNVRRRPTLPRPPGRSTIGAGGLNFQVRNGDWVFPRRYGHRNSIKISTKTYRSSHTPQPFGGCGGLGVLAVFREPYSEREHRYIAQCLWSCRQHTQWGCWIVTSPRPISTSQLHNVTALPLLAYQPSGLLGA